MNQIKERYGFEPEERGDAAGGSADERLVAIVALREVGQRGRRVRYRVRTPRPGAGLF